MRCRILLAALVGLAALPSAASSAEFRVLSSWARSYEVVPVFLEAYLKNVETASKGDMKFTLRGPETVPPFEQLQPVSTGVFHMLLTHGAYHVGQTPYLLSAEGLTGDLAKWRDVGVRDMIDRHYQTKNLKLVLLGQTPERSALTMILKQPVGASGDLQGRKIRGTQTFSGVFSLLGASPIVLPIPDTYPALEKGTVDGAASPVLGLAEYRWYEVAKYVVRPAFGKLIYPVFFNLDAWNKLTEQQRKILVEEGRKAEDAFYPEWTKMTDREWAKLAQNGAQYTEAGADKKDKVERAHADGLFTVGAQYNAKDIGELRNWAKSKELN